MTFDDRPEPAKRLEQARIARGFKEAKAAAIYFGWKYNSYAQHENGTRGIIRVVDKYARAFRVSSGWLLTGEGSGPEKTPSMVQVADMVGAGPGGNRDDRWTASPQYQIKNWLKKCLEDAGHGSKTRLAKELNVRPDAITRMINIDDDGKEPRLIKAHELATITRFFGKEPPGSNTSNMRFLPIRGLAGAGPDSSVLYAIGDGNFGEIEAPKDAAKTTEALEVRGDSMYGLANDGYIIFYEDHETPSEKHIGHMCVCFLEDDRVLVKIPYPGSERGLFHLESVNAPVMRDVPVRHFSIVTDIKTRYAAQKFVRRYPSSQIQDVSSSGQRL